VVVLVEALEVDVAEVEVVDVDVAEVVGGSEQRMGKLVVIMR
jgi:hypothetical protein